jgi:hypothetical protein
VGQPVVGGYILRSYIDLLDTACPETFADAFLSVADALGHTIDLVYLNGIVDVYTLVQHVTDFGPTGYGPIVHSQLPINLSINLTSATTFAQGRLIVTALPAAPPD